LRRHYFNAQVHAVERKNLNVNWEKVGKHLVLAWSKPAISSVGSVTSQHAQTMAVSLNGIENARFSPRMGHIDHMMFTSKQYRWLGTVCVVGAVAILFAVTKIIDVPGPMEPSKPEFTFEFCAPLTFVSSVLTLTGIWAIVSSFNGSKKNSGLSGSTLHSNFLISKHRLKVTGFEVVDDTLWESPA
jgi:hypothetical protein